MAWSLPFDRSEDAGTSTWYLGIKGRLSSKISVSHPLCSSTSLRRWRGCIAVGWTSFIYSASPFSRCSFMSILNIFVSALNGSVKVGEEQSSPYEAFNTLVLSSAGNEIGASLTASEDNTEFILVCGQINYLETLDRHSLRSYRRWLVSPWIRRSSNMDLSSLPLAKK